MQVIAHLDNRDRRVPFEKGSIIPVTLSDGRQIIVSYEPSIARGNQNQQDSTTLTDIDSFMITSRRHNKNMVLSHLQEEIVRTIWREKRNGTIKSRVVNETLWYKAPDGTIESSNILHI